MWYYKSSKKENDSKLTKGTVAAVKHINSPWHPSPLLLPGKSHGRRSLVGCSPWGRYESDTTERLRFDFHALEKEMATHSSVFAWRIPGMGEPGGLPSMGSQSRTGLKRLSSSSIPSFIMQISRRSWESRPTDETV